MGDPCTTASLDEPLDTPQSYDGLSYLGHMVAGAAAGMGEHIAMYPVDTIKTRMQALAHPGQQLSSSVAASLVTVLRREGLGGLYRGVGAMALGAGPSHALYFASYEAAKQALGGNKEGHHPLATAAAGSFATVVNDGCMTPWDVIKQRMQVRHSPYRSIVHCAIATWQAEGLRAFYKSYWTTLVMNVPYTALHFAIYESAKKAMVAEGWAGSSARGTEDEDEGLVVQLVAGGLAGGLSAAATTPLDVVKTRLQLEGLQSAARYGTVSVWPVLSRIAAEEGTASLWRGWQPRVLFHAPAAAICWGVYETCKRLLGAA